MKRKDFLKSVGAIGVSSLLPFDKTNAAIRSFQARFDGGGACVLIPQETEGPYPLNLSGSETYFRQDITEGKTGLPLELTLTIVNINDNCNPIANARVDVWHCDKDGVYSGYNQPGANTVGETFCRGSFYFITSAKCYFTSIKEFFLVTISPNASNTKPSCFAIS